MYNLLSEYSDYLRAEIKFSAITKRNYLSDIRHFIDWTQANKTQEGLNEEDFTSYIDTLVSDDIPERSINRKLSSLRSFFDFCLVKGYVDRNYARNRSNISTTTNQLIDFDEDLGLSNEQRIDIEEFINIINH